MNAEENPTENNGVFREPILNFMLEMQVSMAQIFRLAD
jgi:hypothetical protein